TFADIEKEVSNDLGAERRVSDFRMKLHAEQLPIGVFEPIQCICRYGRHTKAWRRRSHLIAVTHPDIHLRRQARKQFAVLIQHLQTLIAEFAAVGRLNLSPHLESEKMEPV